MKISTPQSLLFTLVFLGMGFVAIGLTSSACPTQGATQAKRPTQQGYGHAPYPPVGQMLGGCVAKQLEKH